MNWERFRLLLLGAGCGVMSALEAYFTESSVSAGQIMNALAYGNFSIGKGAAFAFMLRYFPWILLQAVLGIFLYQHFCTASVYYFPRLSNRLRWYAKESLEMFLYVFLYVLVFVMSAILTISVSAEVMMGEADIWIVASFILTHVMWVYAMVLLVNILSILWGSSAGFMGAMGLQLVLLGYFSALESQLDFVPKYVPGAEDMVVENLEQKSMLLQLNPISHLVLKWHSGEIGGLQVYENEFGIDFPMIRSVILFAVIAVVAWTAGAIIVKKQDFVTVNRETGGV